MRKFVFALFVMAFSCTAFAQEMRSFSSVAKPASGDCVKVVQEYLLQYPKATLVDIYKWFFQSVYGPAHLADDPGVIESRLRMEIDALSEKRDPSRKQVMPAYEYIGLDRRYVRVNLLLVLAGTVDVEMMLDALMRTIDESGEGVPVDQWRDEWERIVEDLRKLDKLPENFENDQAAIMKQLEQGNVVMHHSKQFNEAYDIHYRVISAAIFENEILPLIKF